MYGWHKNNSPKRWVGGEFIGRHRDNLLDRKAVAGQVKMLGTKITGDIIGLGHYTKRWSA